MQNEIREKVFWEKINLLEGLEVELWKGRKNTRNSGHKIDKGRQRNISLQTADINRCYIPLLQKSNFFLAETENLFIPSKQVIKMICKTNHSTEKLQP